MGCNTINALDPMSRVCSIDRGARHRYGCSSSEGGRARSTSDFRLRHLVSRPLLCLHRWPSTLLPADCVLFLGRMARRRSRNDGFPPQVGVGKRAFLVWSGNFKSSGAIRSRELVTLLHLNLDCSATFHGNLSF